VIRWLDPRWICSAFSAHLSVKGGDWTVHHHMRRRDVGVVITLFCSRRINCRSILLAAPAVINCGIQLTSFWIVPHASLAPHLWSVVQTGWRGGEFLRASSHGRDQVAPPSQSKTKIVAKLKFLSKLKIYQLISWAVIWVLN